MKQKELHMEFCDLFERICVDFLRDEGYTIERFYEELHEAHRQLKDSKNAEANEIVEVIYQVVDFEAWAEDMKQQAKNRKKYSASRFPNTH